jgi:hypothetical protein
MHPEQPRDPSPRRWPKRLGIALLALLALAGAVPVLFNLLLIAGFWLNPPIQPEEEDEMAAGMAVVPVPIQASDLGREWPLRVPSGYLNCSGDGAITFHHASEYALTPEARALGHPDVAEIANAGASTEPLLRRAREMCAAALAS